MSLSADQIRQLAHECGFELAGVVGVAADLNYERYTAWREAGMAGGMTYLTDRRGDLRQDPRHLLAAARSVVCVGKLYNHDAASSDCEEAPEAGAQGRIARYACGLDYHGVLRTGLEQLAKKIAAVCGEAIEWRVCVDTAPLLERSLARQAGLGWIGKNTCLINQEQGSWFFLGELLLSIAIEPDGPPPDRCGTCRRCLDACPTQALISQEDGGSFLDARLCISYLTIEHRGTWPEGTAEQTGAHLFGCDICQEVCPWNRDAPISQDAAFGWRTMPSNLAELSEMSAEEFAAEFRATPVARARHSGFLRNVAMAMGQAHRPELLEPLRKMTDSADPVVAAAAAEALSRWANGGSEGGVSGRDMKAHDSFQAMRVAIAQLDRSVAGFDAIADDGET